jgi:hypothetical protein
MKLNGILERVWTWWVTAPCQSWPCPFSGRVRIMRSRGSNWMESAYCDPCLFAMGLDRECVCLHRKVAHRQVYAGLFRPLGTRCQVEGCACGPGCIHEGYVPADGEY